jgi:hypothetical protein
MPQLNLCWVSRMLICNYWYWTENSELFEEYVDSEVDCDRFAAENKKPNNM